MNAAEILAVDAVRDAVYAHVGACLPNEACGLLVTGPNGPEAILTDNLQDRYHDLDPETFVRTGTQAYLLNPLVIKEAEERGRTVVAIFHSHPGCGAYFSAEDQRQAVSPTGEPLYPDVQHVVIDARADGIRGFKTFAWVSATGRFEELRV